MFGAAVTAQIVVPKLGREDLEGLFHALGKALLSLQGGDSALLDHAVALDIGKGIIEISVTTVADDPDMAHSLAEGYLRNAITATGGNIKNSGVGRLSVTSSELVTV